VHQVYLGVRQFIIVVRLRGKVLFCFNDAWAVGHVNLYLVRRLAKCRVALHLLLFVYSFYCNMYIASAHSIRAEIVES
jgi:hypothetical protein